jgi:drug/metabolite transporter (DMT)-like permease
MNNSSQQQKQARNSPHQLLISAGIGFAILCWGGAYVAARFLLHPTTPEQVALSPALLAALRFGIAAIFFMLPLAQAIRQRQVTTHQLLLMALLGQLAFSLYYWLQYFGIQQTDASIAAILGVGLIPLFTTLLAQVFGQERLHVSLFGAFCLGFGGVVLIVLQQPFSASLHSGFFVGALCLVSNTFLFAVYSVLSKRWMRTISPVILTSGTMISGAIGLVLLSFLDPAGNQWGKIVHLDVTQWMALLFLAVGCSVLAYFAYNVALSNRDASRVTVYFYVEPVVTVVLGMVLLGEQLTWQIIIGAIAIGASVVVVNLMKRPASYSLQEQAPDKQ